MFGNVRMCDVITIRIVFCKHFLILVKYQFTVMPRVCSAWNCKNKNKCGKGLYRFPTDDRIRAEWVKRVSGGRGNWKLRPNSCLCSDHFATDCFLHNTSLVKSLGFNFAVRQLKPGSIPTIFHQKVDETEVLFENLINN